VAHSAYVPELQEDVAAFVMHRLGYQIPAFDLLGGMDAGRRGVAFALQGNLRGFGDQKSALCSALTVIGRVDGVGDVAGLSGTQARQRSQYYAVTEVQIANLERREEVWVIRHISVDARAAPAMQDHSVARRFVDESLEGFRWCC